MSRRALSGRPSSRPLLVVLAVLVVLLGGDRGAFAAEPIRVWHAYRDDERKALETILAGWTGPPIDALALPADAFGSKLASAIPLGEGPDLFIDSHERLGDYRARGIVGPVGDAVEDAAVYGGPALDAVGGAEPFGVPLSPKCVALYVNERLVRDVPPDLEGIAALRATLPPDVFPLAYEAQGAYAHAAVLAAFGGRLLEPDDGFGFVGPKAEASLDFVRGLLANRAVPEEADGALVTNLFKSGRAAFAISGPWLAAGLGPDAPPYRVVKLPHVRATGEPLRPLLTVESVMLSPTGAKRPEVRALARFVASAEAARIRMRVAHTPSARLDVPAPPEDPLLAAFAEQAREAVPMPSSRAMRAMWEPANRALRKVMRGEAEPGPALVEAKRRFDDVRRPLPAPASPAPVAVLLGAVALAGAFGLVRRARDPLFVREVRRSLPVYRYVAHAVVAVGVLVVLPLVLGAGTSLFAGSGEDVRYVGLANFVSILTARGGPLLASGSFWLVLLVTILWTAINVALHVLLGVSLGLLLSKPWLRFRALYRVLLIVPWAVPSYVTALAWKGMFHRQFGAVTGLVAWLNEVCGTNVEPIAWFSRFSTAFTANVATNVWLGFPFMMVVTLGALTAVPDEVLEAAEVDGATRWQKLRLVTLPLIRRALVPAVTLGTVWTFNMFNVVFLVSGGDPDGTTDILISEAYRWAFTREAQYGYAAAYAVLILILLAFASRLLAGRRVPRGQREAAGALRAEAAS